MNAADPRDLQALPERHRLFWDEAAPLLPADHMMCDPFRTLAFGTDASFYRLVPRIVAKVRSREEVTRLLALADRRAVPVTFRAAGTSLSGQAVTDSVLLVLAGGWRGCAVHDGGARIALEPGVVGAEANAALAAHGRKIGPDPASINSCMVGRHRRQQRGRHVLRHGAEQLPDRGEHAAHPRGREPPRHRRSRRRAAASPTATGSCSPASPPSATRSPPTPRSPPASARSTGSRTRPATPSTPSWTSRTRSTSSSTS